MQKVNQQNHGYSYTTAPSCRLDPMGKMSPIQFEVLDESAREAIMANLDGNAPRNYRFRGQLPLILTGQPCDWTLWDVQIKPQRLVFAFTNYSNDDTGAQAKAMDSDKFQYFSPLFRHYDPREATLIVRRPENLRCTFVIPPIDGEPEIKVRCHYYLTGDPGMDGRQRQTLWICERRGEETQFSTRLRTPVLPSSPAAEGRID